MKNKHAPRRLKDYGDVLTPAEVMEFLGCGRNSVYTLLSTGEIQSIRIGKKYLIPKRYLLDYLGGKRYNGSTHNNGACKTQSFPKEGST